MRKISGAWSGMGALEGLRGWRKWARREAKRRAKDVFCAQRDELKWAADCVAALELAQWTVDKVRLGVPSCGGAFVDECHHLTTWVVSFSSLRASSSTGWTHRETGVTVWDEAVGRSVAAPWHGAYRGVLCLVLPRPHRRRGARRHRRDRVDGVSLRATARRWPRSFPKVSWRLVIEDERTWLRIKDEQAEAKRMELKEGLEEYSDSENETRTMVTEGLI